MAIMVTARIECDMCGRTQEVAIKESWRWGKLDCDAPGVVGLFSHWEMLGREGHPVTDWRYGEGKVLCEQCANVYRDALETKQREIDAMFKGRR